jgi:PhnB protein
MFNGNCEAAFKFYEQCLGGKIVMMLTNSDVPAQWHDKIMHICLNLGDRLLMGSDSPPGYFETPQGFYVQISVDEPAEAERVFHALAENGKVKMPLEQTFCLCALVCWSINSVFPGWLIANRRLDLLLPEVLTGLSFRLKPQNFFADPLLCKNSKE